MQYAERPILFQTEMVKAILEGRKTQTRRDNKIANQWDPIWQVSKESDQSWCMRTGSQYSVPYFKCPYGQPGDMLWVRETWGQPYLEEDLANCKYLYKADWNAINQVKQAIVGERWKPSIHMPKSASRIWLMIEDIRVERVQDINESDARAEGVAYIKSDKFFHTGYLNYLKRDLDDPNYMLAMNSFASLWIMINGEESWNENPWVWVVQFRVLSMTGRPSDEVIAGAYEEVVNLKSEIVNL
jgi:hypothetical protein